MAYAVRDDIVDRYSASELLIVSDRNGDGVEDDDIITSALEDAASEIDSYLKVRYSLPFSSPPAVLTRVSIDIAMYRMSENAASLTDERRKRYDDAIAFLVGIAKGDISLGDDGSETQSLHNAVLVSSDDRVWARDKQRGLY